MIVATKMELGERIDGFNILDASNPWTSGKYTSCYTGIARANAILDRIDDAEFDGSVLKGEALFLRAYFYFELVQFYGGVPLHLAEVSAQEDAALPRSTVEEVYNVILNDITQATSLLLDESQTENGRASRGAANMLLAYVHMTRNNFAEAESALEAVTGYDLEPNYADIFDTGNKFGPEMIFAVQYQEGNQGQQK